jgi:hypothetical protein
MTKKIREFLNKPEIKKLHKEAMKFQGMEKLIKKLKEKAES